MCFSNLPIEFDENGNPSLAEEAETVERPTCGCGGDGDVALDESDPREAYDAIVETVSEDVRRHLEGSPRETDDPRDSAREEAEGD